MISSSKFLMGESDSSAFKKIWISWAIKPGTIQCILAGEFTLGDRSTLLDFEYQKQLETIRDLNNEKELISSRLLRLEEDVQKNLKQKIQTAIDGLSDQQLSEYRQAFATKLQQGSDATSQEFKEKGWDGRLIETIYAIHLRDLLAQKLQGLSFAQAVEREIKQHPMYQTLEQERQQLEASVAKQRLSLQDLATERKLTFALLTGESGATQSDGSPSSAHAPNDRRKACESNQGRATGYSTQYSEKSDPESTELAPIAGTVQAIIAKHQRQENV
ncbi:MAG: hypothetical protein ABFQ95_05785 [Pseudomonadota bacterium]